jgi:acetyl-CoA synthetase (ADP-forming)
VITAGAYQGAVDALVSEKLRIFLQRTDKSVVLEHEAKVFLKDIDLPVPRGVFFSGDALAAAAVPDDLGYPLVAKVASTKIPSKTEVRGVRMGIRNRDELRIALAELSSIRDAEGVLVEAEAQRGLEVIVGGIRDEQFGPVVMFGLGGIFVELFTDIAFALAPLSRAQALWLARQVKGYRLLEGYRGSPPVDMEALIRVLPTVSQLIASEFLDEIDLNPVALYNRGCMILDAKMFVKDRAAP